MSCSAEPCSSSTGWYQACGWYGKRRGSSRWLWQSILGSVRIDMTVSIAGRPCRSRPKSRMGGSAPSSGTAWCQIPPWDVCRGPGGARAALRIHCCGQYQRPPPVSPQVHDFRWEGSVSEPDIAGIRENFDFVRTGRIVTNNGASTQPPRQLLDLYRNLIPCYENVHRGQSDASMWTTERFESAYDTIAAWLNAPNRRTVATYGNTTEAINAVMYSLLTEFRDGDNVVTTMLEHNSNYVPWHALCREILPRFGVRVQCP